MTSAIDWVDQARFRLGDTEFIAAELRPGESTPTRFLVRKPRSLIEAYAELIDELQPRVIADVGIYEGACAAFIAAYARPERLAAVDIEPEFPALAGFVEANGLSRSVTIHAGVDQRDRTALLAAIDAGLGAGPIDLVIDDASHMYAPTVTSFEALFPRVRPGGRYVIEDWAIGPLASERIRRQLLVALPDLATDDETLALVHEFALRTTSAHVDNAVMGRVIDPTDARGEHPITSALAARLIGEADGSVADLRDHLAGFLGDLPPRRPFADVVLDVLRLQAIAPEIIAAVEVSQWWVVIDRGPADLDPDTFRLGEHGAVRAELRL